MPKDTEELVFKKIFRFIRLSIIGILWTYIFVLVSNWELISLWNFNFLSSHSWKTISRFWQAGGVIKSAKDYLFLLNLILIPVVWIWGWRYLARQNYISILIWPYTAYNNYMIKKLSAPSKIALKNVGSASNDVEIIKNQIESIKPEKPKEVLDIRKNIQNKINTASDKK